MATSNANTIKVTRSARINTLKGRVSYPHVFKPSAFQDTGEPKFSIILLIPKDGSEAHIKQLKALQEAATKELYPTKKPTNFEQWGISDGDEKVTKDGDADAVTAGCWIVKASNKDRPAIIDQQKNEIFTETDFYGGCYARANICAKAYGTPSKGGVTFELNVVQKMADGEAFGGAAAAKQGALDEMDEVEEMF